MSNLWGWTQPQMALRYFLEYPNTDTATILSFIRTIGPKSYPENAPQTIILQPPCLMFFLVYLGLTAWLCWCRTIVFPSELILFILVSLLQSTFLQNCSCEPLQIPVEFLCGVLTGVISSY